MANVGNEFFREQLTERRQRLDAIAARAGRSAELEQLVAEVDQALERLEHGSFGICEACHEPLEKPRLIADPLARFCLDHLSSQQQRALEQDLQLAARIQSALLPPRNLGIGGWQVHYHYEPAGPVSGDYCDLIVADRGSSDLFFLLGDVSGKGVAASMLMTHLHAMFRSLVTVGQPLERMVGIANSVFCESTISGQYATLVCGRAANSGAVEIASAGHVPALLVGGSDLTEIEATGFPLGMFHESRYEVRRFEVEPGASLLLYTDGLTEARSSSQGEYGVKRLARFVRERAALGPEALAAACVGEVKAFAAGAPRNDDVTLMVLRRSG